VKLLPNSLLTRYFLVATIVAFVAAVAFTVPVIVPEFTFPLELTIWPGTWMFEAYFAFLIVGVLGNLGWAAAIDLMRRNTQKEYSSRYLALTHIALSNIGVYGATGFMFAVGYLGGAGALVGYGKAAITQSIIGWMVVPIGVFIYLYILASLFGAVNLFLMFGSRRAEPAELEGIDYRRSDRIFWGVFVVLVSLVFVLLPVLEIPYYPNNFFQEVSVMAASTVGLVGGASLLAYGGLTRPHLGQATPARSEHRSTA